MIESFMLCGIGLLAGCLLMLTLMPFVHHRAVRLTRRDIVDATPLAINEIQAERDHLRAQFAMSLRRLEVNLEEMRAKAAGHSGEIGRRDLEISRLHVELDRKKTQIMAMRARDQVRRSIVRRAVKIVSYVFVRSDRQRRRETFEEMLGQISRRA
jgi:hypothetical protein